MGWKPKADEEREVPAAKAADAAPAPGKKARTDALPAAKKPPAVKEPAARQPSIGELNVAREPDDPFGFHLLDNEELGLPPAVGPREGARTRFPREEYLVWQDYQLLAPAGVDLGTPDEYVRRVKTTWGSLQSYLMWRNDSDALLDKPLPSGGTVRRIINEHGETQRVFFYWVSWEYHRRGLDDAAIVALFEAQIVGQMREAIAAAEAKLGATIPVQGFCPRPQRDDHGYVMGTLSEHGLGHAVDIEPSKNPIVGAATWHAIEARVGRKVDRSRRRWEQHPDQLYDDLVAFSLAWAAIVVDEIEAARRAPARAANFARRHPGTLVDYGGVGRPDAAPHPLLDDIPPPVDDKQLAVKTIARLLHVDLEEAAPLAATPGYELVSHPRKRVLALREQGLVWGATFPNCDIHHFELASPPLAPWFVDDHRRPPTRTDPDFESSLERF